MQQQPPGPSGDQWTIKLPPTDYYGYPGGPEVVAVTDADLWALQHGYAAVSSSSGGGDEHQPQQQQRQQQLLQQHKPRPAPAFANVVMAGAYYASAMHPAAGGSVASVTGGAAVYWQQHRSEDGHVVYRSPAAELPFVFHQVWSVVPCRVPRQKLPLESASRQAAVMCADEADDGHEPGDQAAGYDQQDQHAPHPFQQQQNWDQDDDYGDEVPGANGQGDGDTPSFYGGGGEGGASEDAAVLLEEQDEVVALLVEVDERHEKQLAFERVLQERDATTCWRRRTRPHHHMRSASSSESLDVFVKTGLWRSVSDRAIYESVRREHWYSPAAHWHRSLFFPEPEANDDESLEDGTGSSSPTITLNIQAIAETSSSVEAEAEENEPVVIIPSTEVDPVPEAVHPKAAAADTFGAKEKTRPLPTPSPVQRKQSVCPQPAQEQPQQKQDVPPLAVPGHQQRRLPEYKRSSYPRREYHSTRRYESDHVPPPPPPQERALGAGRPVRNEVLPQQNGRYRDVAFNNRPVNQPDLSYSKDQQAHGNGNSGGRTRSRINRHSNGHGQWSKSNARMDASDVGNRGSSQRSSLPYCCRKIPGAAGVTNPVHSEPPPPPPPQSRGRHYNRQKEGVPQAQGHHPSSRPSPQRGNIANREAMSAGGRGPATVIDSARPPTHQRASVAADTPLSSSRNRRPPRSDFNHPRGGAAGEMSDAPPPKPCESMPSRGDGDAALGASTDCEPPAETDQRRSVRDLWERAPFSRRRTPK